MADELAPGEIPQGFGDAPLPTYVYIKGDKESQTCWHKWNHQANGGAGEAIPIKNSCFYGRFIGFRMVRTEFKNKPAVKLEIQMTSAAGAFNFRSGIDTAFSRGFLLAAMLIEDFEQDYGLAVSLGNDGNVVFCRVYDAVTKSAIRYKWDAEVVTHELANVLQEKIGSPVQDYFAVLNGTANDIPDGEFSGPPEDGEAEPKSGLVQAPPNRPMPSEFYATDTSDVIGVKDVATIQKAAEQKGIDDHDFSMEVFNCPVGELSKKGGKELLERINNLQK